MSSLKNIQSLEKPHWKGNLTDIDNDDEYPFPDIKIKMNQTTHETHYNYDYRCGITRTLPRGTKIFDKSRLNDCKTIDKIVEKMRQQHLKNNGSWQDLTNDDDDPVLVIIKHMFQMIKKMN